MSCAAVRPFCASATSSTSGCSASQRRNFARAGDSSSTTITRIRAARAGHGNVTLADTPSAASSSNRELRRCAIEQRSRSRQLRSPTPSARIRVRLQARTRVVNLHTSESPHAVARTVMRTGVELFCSTPCLNAFSSNGCNSIDGTRPVQRLVGDVPMQHGAPIETLLA